MEQRGTFMPWECYAFFHFPRDPVSAFSNNGKGFFLILGQNITRFLVAENECILM